MGGRAGLACSSRSAAAHCAVLLALLLCSAVGDHRACALLSLLSLLRRPPAMRSGLQAHLAAGAAAINTSGSAPTFSLAYDSSSKPGRIGAQAGKQLPPGAEFVTKAASKNAKKRANKKAKAAGGGDGSDDEQPAQQQQPAPAAAPATAGVAAVTEQVQGRAAMRMESARRACCSAEEQLVCCSCCSCLDTRAAAASLQMAGASVSGAGGDAADAAQKRVRALQKKLRQIQQLKEKRDTEGARQHVCRRPASARAATQQCVAQADARCCACCCRRGRAGAGAATED